MTFCWHAPIFPRSSELHDSEILRCGTDDHLIDLHLGRLSDRVSDRIGRNRHLVKLAQILSGRLVRAALWLSVATAPGETIVQRIFWEWGSIMSPSVWARTAAFVRSIPSRRVR